MPDSKLLHYQYDNLVNFIINYRNHTDMAEIRLDNIKKAYGISLATLVDFLNENGANVEQDPNATVSADFLPIIKKRFNHGITPLKPTIRIFNTSSTLDNANDASWEKLVNAHASDRHVTGTVKRKYKHGFIVEVDGHEGKLPFLSLSNIKNKDNLIGQTIELFVIRVDRITKDVVFTQNSLHRR